MRGAEKGTRGCIVCLVHTYTFVEKSSWLARHLENRLSLSCENDKPTARAKDTGGGRGHGLVHRAPKTEAEHVADSCISEQSVVAVSWSWRERGRCEGLRGKRGRDPKQKINSVDSHSAGKSARRCLYSTTLEQAAVHHHTAPQQAGHAPKTKKTNATDEHK